MILGLSFVTCIIGLAQTFLRFRAHIEAMAKAGDNMALSFAGLTLLTILCLICRILIDLDAAREGIRQHLAKGR